MRKQGRFYGIDRILTREIFQLNGRLAKLRCGILSFSMNKLWRSLRVLMGGGRQRDERHLRRHAVACLKLLFPDGYEGEFFLCAGAFKPWLQEGIEVRDYDLYVRNRKDREQLHEALLARGAVLIQDFQPFCRLYRMEKHKVEVTYHNVKAGGLPEIFALFDLSIGTVGLQYRKGRLLEVEASEECWATRRDQEVRLCGLWRERLLQAKQPNPLGTIQRMPAQAERLGFGHSKADLAFLWECFESCYSKEQKEVAIDIYQRIAGEYKGEMDEALLARAQRLTASHE